MVHDPEDAASGVIRRLAHDLVDQALERRDAGARLTATEYLCAMHIERRQVSPGAIACVLVLHAHRLARPGGQTWVDAQARLDAALLVGGDDEFILAQCLPLPAPLVQV